MRKFVVKVRVFLGLDLPERTMDLDFSLPKISDNFKASEVNNDDLFDDLEVYKNNPVEYLKVLVAEIKHLNRCSLKMNQRLSLNRDIIELYFAMGMGQVARLSKTGGGIPEPEEHKLILIMLAEIAQTLIVSYQILFEHYYGLSNYKYARSHKKVLECVSRLFELLALKQQVKALRYQLLDASDWKLANTLFYVMSCYEDVDLPLQTQKKALNPDERRGKVSVREHYVSLHIVAKFNVLRWPSHLQWVIRSYLRGIDEPVQVMREEAGHVLASHDLIAYCYGDQPAHEYRLETPLGGGIIFRLNNLIEAVQKDCVSMMRSKKHQDISQVLPRFARLPEREHFVIFDQLMRGLEHEETDPVTKRAKEIEDLRIFVGFSEVFSLLQHRQSKFGGEERLVDKLSKRSALIAEDSVATKESIWSLLYQDDKMIRLSTQETSFTTAMRIGSLFACGLGENVNRPSLAVVTRIFRPSHKLVVVDVSRIASFADPVILTINATPDQTLQAHQKKAALLVYDHRASGQWSLMFAPQDVALGVDQFAIHYRKQVFPVRLSAMRNATNDFYLFSTTLESAQLGVTGEPDYTIPPVKHLSASGWLV